MQIGSWKNELILPERAIREARDQKLYLPSCMRVIKINCGLIMRLILMIW